MCLQTVACDPVRKLQQQQQLWAVDAVECDFSLYVAYMQDA